LLVCCIQLVAYTRHYSIHDGLAGDKPAQQGSVEPTKTVHYKKTLLQTKTETFVRE